MNELSSSEELATPKTDAVAFYITNERVRREAVFADFARAQERRIAELVEALKPFARFACDEALPKCDCFNCKARAVIQKEMTS